MSETVDLPPMQDYPATVQYNNGSVLLRYNDGVVTRIEDVEWSVFLSIKNYVDSRNEAKLRIAIIKLISNSDMTRTYGTRVDLPENIPEKVTAYCDHCSQDKEFFLQGKYRGLHGSCVGCGGEISTLVTDCQTCNESSVFISRHSTDDRYTCYNCDTEL